jgi:hypothetical protein
LNDWISAPIFPGEHGERWALGAGGELVIEDRNLDEFTVSARREKTSRLFPRGARVALELALTHSGANRERVLAVDDRDALSRLFAAHRNELETRQGRHRFTFRR